MFSRSEMAIFEKIQILWFYNEIQRTIDFLETITEDSQRRDIEQLLRRMFSIGYDMLKMSFSHLADSAKSRLKADSKLKDRSRYVKWGLELLELDKSYTIVESNKIFKDRHSNDEKGSESPGMDKKTLRKYRQVAKEQANDGQE